MDEDTKRDAFGKKVNNGDYVYVINDSESQGKYKEGDIYRIIRLGYKGVYCKKHKYADDFVILYPKEFIYIENFCRVKNDIFCDEKDFDFLIELSLATKDKKWFRHIHNRKENYLKTKNSLHQKISLTEKSKQRP